MERYAIPAAIGAYLLLVLLGFIWLHRSTKRQENDQ